MEDVLETSFPGESSFRFRAEPSPDPFPFPLPLPEAPGTLRVVAAAAADEELDDVDGFTPV